MSDDLAQQLFGAPTPMESEPTQEEQQNLSVQEEYNKLLREHAQLKDKYEALQAENDELKHRLEGLEK